MVLIEEGRWIVMRKLVLFQECGTRSKEGFWPYVLQNPPLRRDPTGLPRLRLSRRRRA